MRKALLVPAIILLVLGALCEVRYVPVPLWFYLGVIALVAVALVRIRPLREQWKSLLSLGVIVAATLALPLADWNTRKPFLRDLARIRPGMTEAEARKIMSGYMEGTGWPANPFTGADTRQGTLTDSSIGTTCTTSASPGGELVLDGRIVFRHSDDAAFDSDWGIVRLEQGRVVDVAFSMD